MGEMEEEKGMGSGVRGGYETFLVDQFERTGVRKQVEAVQGGVSIQKIFYGSCSRCFQVLKDESLSLREELFQEGSHVGHSEKPILYT